MTEHSPTPWRLLPRADPTDRLCIVDGDGIAVQFPLMDLPPPQECANTEYVILCVNAHDELVAALEKLLAELWRGLPEQIEAARTHAYAALAKARGNP